MSDIFFEELGMPAPDYHLGIGSGPHGAQTGAMLAAVESVIQKECPDAVIVYGDTNSTLAGALAATKLHIPVAHVEAGLRSFNRRMPEEINRVLSDHVSTLLFCPSEIAVQHLAQEGITDGVHVVGDIMLDVQSFVREQAVPSNVLEALGVSEKSYILATVHRAENTDNSKRLQAIVNALNAIDTTIVFPVHPRTRAVLKTLNLELAPHVKLANPLGY